MTDISGPIDLSGRVAIVTGAARGIGRAICLALAREGAAVAVADVLDGEGTTGEIRARGGRALFVRTNVTDRAQVTALVERAREELGAVHILVNNAGTLGRVGLEETSDEIWARDVDTIMRGTYLCTQAVYPLMKDQR